MNFRHRSDQIEMMDDLDCKGPVIDQTLKELDVINTLLGGNQISIQAFKRIVKSNPAIKRFVDLGCGGGDILKVLANWCRKNDKKISFIGIDANPNIVAYARKNCEKFPEINIEQLNILDNSFDRLNYDLLHCCLFTHHFTNKELVGLFSKFHKANKAKVIINDLHRHPLAYYSIKWLTKIFSKSEMVRYDAGVSVLRGFRKEELQSILREAGIQDFQLTWRWAFRWKLVF